MYFFNNFIIYSILGFIMESTIYKIKDSTRHSGILFGPYTLVYGIGVIAILLINKYVSKLKLNKFLKIIILYITFVISLTLIEWLGGNIIHQIFGIDLWDYTNHPYNLGKYVSFSISLTWGLLGLIVVYIIKPITDKIIKLTNNTFTNILLSIILIDSILTLILKGL